MWEVESATWLAQVYAGSRSRCERNHDWVCLGVYPSGLIGPSVTRRRSIEGGVLGGVTVALAPGNTDASCVAGTPMTATIATGACLCRPPRRGSRGIPRLRRCPVKGPELAARRQIPTVARSTPWHFAAPVRRAYSHRTQQRPGRCTSAHFPHFDWSPGHKTSRSACTRSAAGSARVPCTTSAVAARSAPSVCSRMPNGRARSALNRCTQHSAGR